MGSQTRDKPINPCINGIDWYTGHSIQLAIQRRVVATPDKTPLIFLSEQGNETPISYARLDADARSVALTLFESHIQAEDLVVLILPHSYEQVAAFFGVIYYGAIPTIFADFNLQPDAYQKRVVSFVQSCGADAILTSPETAHMIGTQLNQIHCMPIIMPDLNGQAPDKDTSAILSSRGGEDIAYIQFSSGTMGAPKGTMISHRAVINQIYSSYCSGRVSTNDILIGWLPYYHDMGLIESVIVPVIRSIQAYQISPAHWLKRPQSLFQAINRHKGTVTWMPTFAFSYCTKRLKPEELTGLDLSSWRIVGSGAEPVSMNTMQGFAEHFASYGLKPTALGIGYGLAENTLSVTVTPPGIALAFDWVSRRDLQEKGLATPVESSHPDAIVIAPCGFPMPGVEIRIIDEQGAILPDRTIGEILVRSDYLFSGYYRQPDLTAAVLQNGWLYTGDLGYLVDGQLYVHGRKKDLIIVGGQNVLPHHIEEVAARLLGAHASRVAAFGIEDTRLGTELPILICEIIEQDSLMSGDSLAEQIRRKVIEETGIALGDVRFVNRGWIEVSTSGKIARPANRQKYIDNFHTPALSGAYKVSPEQHTTKPDHPLQAIAQQLSMIFSNILGVGDVGPDDNFFALGGDSLSALRLVLQVSEQLGKEVPAEFFKEPTVAHLIKMLGDTQSQNIKGPGIIHREKPKQQHSRRQSPLLNLRRRILNTETGFKHRLGVLSWLCGQTWYQNRFYSQQVSLIKEFYATLENPLPNAENTIHASLVINIGRQWEHPIKLLTDNQALMRWTDVQGVEHFKSAMQKDKGVILVSLHTTGNHLLSHVLKQHIGSEYMSVYMMFGKGGQPLPTEQRRRRIQSHASEQITQAYYMLQHGGTVVLLGEGSMGVTLLSQPFHNRLWNFKGGGFELAQTTGAALIPVVASVDRHWHLSVKFLPPLQESLLFRGRHDGDPEFSAINYKRALLDKYIELLTWFWANHPASIPWRVMKKHITLPHADN